jgi:hypothetical protein
MKKRVLFILGLFLVALLAGVISAADDDLENMTEEERVSLAYDCLYDSIQEKNCSRLSLEEQIFSLLAIGECYDEVMDASRLEECWPKTGCDIKTTALAVLALDNANQDIEKAKDWLLSQNATPTDLNWYLEIESDKKTTCSISYDGKENIVNIGEDKKISSNAGSCLALDSSGYWLRINPNCYSKNFDVSCNEDFLTTLLFKNPDSPTVYVVDETHSAAADGTTTEKIKSMCFSESEECNYEESLWATTILDLIGEEVGNFAPYLISQEEENKELFPEPFMYLITGFPEYKAEIVLRQQSKGSWSVLNGEYYSTALALYPFQGSSLDFKDKAIEWLFDVQSEEGCWDNKNIRNNAFILHSIWPKRVSISGGGAGDIPGIIDDDDPCEEAEYKCVRDDLCDGEFLDYECSGSLVCCDPSSSEIEQDTCESIYGEICSSDEVCANGETWDASDLEPGEVCCVWGTCRESGSGSGGNDEVSECVDRGGICELNICGEGYKERTIWDCDEYNEVCCVEDSGSGIEPGKTDENKSYWWLWVLFALIILVTLGILFKDKLREFLIKIKTRGGKKGGSSSSRRPPHFPPRGPPQYPRTPMRRPMPQRKILPPHMRKPSEPPSSAPAENRPPIKKPLPNSKNKELDDVLKKLKEMGK